MKNNILDKIFNVENFIYCSVFTMLLNSVGIFRITKFSSRLSIVLFVYLFVSVIYRAIRDKEVIEFKDYKIEFLLLLASILSLFANLNYIAKNVYSVVSILVNFFIFYHIPKEHRFTKVFNNTLRIIMYATIVMGVINLLMLTFGYSKLIDGQFIGINTLRGRFTGLSMNSNGLSRVALSSIFATILWYSFNKKKCNLFFYFSFIINTLIILLSQSRGTNISLIFGLTGALFYWVLNRNIKLASKVVYGGLVVLLSAVLILNSTKISKVAINIFPQITISNPGDDINETDEDTGLVDREDNNNVDFTTGRTTLMRYGIEATINKQPLFGLSYGGNKTQIQNYLDENNIQVLDYIYNGAGSMHNVYVQFFVNYGLIGLLAFILFAIPSYFKFIKKYFEKDNKNFTYLNLAFTFIFLSLLVLNMVEWVFYFDFDNHLVNYFQMVAFGYFNFGLVTERKSA